LLFSSLDGKRLYETIQFRSDCGSGGFQELDIKPLEGVSIGQAAAAVLKPTTGAPCHFHEANSVAIRLQHFTL
jgi:hypothetical protein